jgi:peptide/nickel transport system substrate-binding protein
MARASGLPRRSRLWCALVTAMALSGVLAACAAPARPVDQSVAPSIAAAAQPAAAPSQPRTVTFAARYEPLDLASKIPISGGADFAKRLFNASPTLISDVGAPIPYLAETLPQVNSDTWRVFPDGRMETTYRLRANLTWHDGTPLSADDFVFAWRVYTAPGLGVFLSNPQDLMEEVAAPDPLTLVVRWRGLYPGAGTLRHGQLDPLPRHILEPPFLAFQRDAVRDSFLNHPYWTDEFVGLGPYRLERWERASLLEAVAFPGHALGRPKIDRVLIRFIEDENTVLTNLLAGEVHATGGIAIRFEHAQVLNREWVPSGKGIVIVQSGGVVYTFAQFRPEFLRTPALMDVRVRKALAYSIEKSAINDVLFDGQTQVPSAFIGAGVPYQDEVERAVAQYPYDPRRTEQLMNEAGFARDREGFFASSAGEAFAPDFQALAGSVFERAQQIMIESWRRSGIQVKPAVLPAAQVRDDETAATFPGLATWPKNANESELLRIFASDEIGTASNRWKGDNRAAFVNPDYDRLWSAYGKTLERSEQVRQIVQMQMLISENVPGIPVYRNPGVDAYVTNLRGPTPRSPETNQVWNIHEWELR